jgi:cell division protein FtsW (lipid II flippase)
MNWLTILFIIYATGAILLSFVVVMTKPQQHRWQNTAIIIIFWPLTMLIYFLFLREKNEHN